MSDLEQKMKKQIELVLEGEAKLEAAAQNHQLKLEAVDARIKQALELGQVFSGDHWNDLILAGYWRGRSTQFIATCADLVGRDEFKRMYNEVCTSMGISNPKQLH